MALLPTGWIKMPGDNDETKRFAWSHVKSIFYNKAANILLKDKLDEMDKIIDEKIAKAIMSNVQVNDQSKIPTSALAYAMQQSIIKNGQDIAKLNNNMSKFDVYHRDVTGSLNDDKIIQTALEDFKNTVVTNKPILVEIQNHVGGRALAVGIQSGTNYNSFLVITYYDRPKEFVYALNHWEVYELVTKSDLTFYKHPLNMTVKMSGKLESIAEWLKNNTTYFGVYNYIRVQEPIDSDGYFGNSSFDIVWNFSSLNYGWITLRSDNPKSIIFGRLVAGKAEWDIPVFKSI